MNAGYTLGGAVWKFNFHSNKLLYAFDINEKDEWISMPIRFQDVKDTYLITNGYLDQSSNPKNK